MHLAVASLYLASRYKEGKPSAYSLQGKGSPLTEWKPFEFYHLPGNDYVLVFNPKNEENSDAPFPTTFYPNSTDLKGSQMIHLADGQDLLNADIQVSNPLPTRQVIIRLVWNGRRPEDFYPPQVIVNAERGTNPLPEETSRHVYTLNLLLGARYTIRAEAFCQMGKKGKVETWSISIDGSDLSISEVTLKFATGECEHK